jgi:TetR/AcrR family transcriptional regulator, regulator of autoinduction and epiphytic fitness
VFSAARAVLRREGVGGATLDAIATEAGVARSTLYRNWSSCDELLAESFDDLVLANAREDASQPLSVRLGKIVVELAHGLAKSEWGEALPSVVAAIDASPFLAGRYRRLTDERRLVVTNLLTSAVSSGEIPKAFPIDDFIDALVGPLFYRRLVRQSATTRSWALQHVARTMTAFSLDT